MRYCFLTFFILTIVLLLVNCQQSLNVTSLPQASTLRAGHYPITGTVSLTVDGAVSTEPISGTLSVYAGQGSEYYFIERIKDKGTASYVINYTYPNLTFQPAGDYARLGFTTYYGSIDKGCTGSVNDGVISYNRSAKIESSGFTKPDGERLIYTVKIRKHTFIETN